MERRKLCVVTGATGGIGKWIALGLAQAGAGVLLVGRDAARGKAAQAWIAGQVAGCEVEVMIADLASLEATAGLGREITARHGRVDVLVLNAGTFLSRREVTAEGHEKVLAVNHLSPFVLIRELEAALRAAAPSRIVTVGSSTSDRAKVDPQNLELTKGWNMVRAYSQSKLAVMMTTFIWAQRLRDGGVTANVVHPGFVGSGLVRTPGVIGLAWRLMKPFARSEEAGAVTPLYAALAAEQAGTTGKYFKDSRIVAPNPLAENAALCARVREATERLVTERK
jgi:NAD(P)-dependent dehydrogenase (short-subunit alcohol dehydrogenase family)